MKLRLLMLGALTALVSADIGTMSPYSPPYLPTACNGNRQDQFPPGDLFIAAGEGLWDNGAACGRRYRLRCLSGPIKGSCKGGTIDVRVVDRAVTAVSKAPKRDATMVLSLTAYDSVVNTVSGKRPDWVNTEYVQI